MASNNKVSIDDLYESIIDSLATVKILEERTIKEYNSKVAELNEELAFFGRHLDKLSTLDWFNETAKLTKIRNDIIELHRLMSIELRKKLE